MSGAVYFISHERRFVKIGYTELPIMTRVYQLQTGNPVALKLVTYIPDATPELEGAFHAAFLGDRVNGEWFRYTRELRKVLVLVSSGARPRTLADIESLKSFKRPESALEQRSGARFDNIHTRPLGLRSRSTLQGASRAQVLTTRSLLSQAAWVSRS